MHKISIAICLLFGSVLFFSCNKKTKPIVSPSYDVEEGKLKESDDPKFKKTPTPKAPPKPYVLASLQRNGCFGNCPEFEFVVMSNGIATYHGKKSTTKIGSFQANVSAGFRFDLEENIKKLDILKLEKMYPASGNFIRELPDSYVLVNLRGERIIIRNNHDAPKNLLDFEKYLEGMIERLDWIRVSRR